jgi:cysteine-rich repeat protein
LEGDEAFFVTLDAPTAATLADALANGAIVDNDSATLTVTKAGTGGGTIVGTGIACPNDCSQFYPLETLVLLTPQASGSGRFTGWSGDCSGTGSCAVVMSSAQAITATFVDLACRNGLREEGEECDDGNDSDNDSCRNNCTIAYCGDDVVRTGVETCDPGSIGGFSASCNPNCTAAECGDGIVNQNAGEECDDGNTANNDACHNNCRDAYCGDGVTRVGVEACDPGSVGGFSASCDPNCTAPVCGDGIVNQDAGEQCDSGMPGTSTPTCDSDCTVPECVVAP